MTRPAILPRSDRPSFRLRAFRWCLAGLAFAMLAAFMLPGCSPRTFSTVNKQAPGPPYVEERPQEYLRVEEPLDAN